MNRRIVAGQQEAIKQEIGGRSHEVITGDTAIPWTPKQTRYLLSKVSPLSATQKAKMKTELHGNPELAHAEKGSSVLSRAVRRTRNA